MTTLAITLAALIGTMLSPLVWAYGTLRSVLDPAYRARCEAKRLGSSLTARNNYKPCGRAP